MLVLVGKVQSLFDMMREEERLFDLGTRYQLLFFDGISNGLGGDLNVCHISKLALKLRSSISFASGDKSHQLTAVIE